MIDGIIKGDGTSRKIKGALPATYEEFKQAVEAGNQLLDILFNAAGWQQQPTFLNKKNLLKEQTAALIGFTEDASVDDALYGLLHIAKNFVVEKIEESGTWTAPKALNQEFTVYGVGGGGGGGQYGGGGGGGYVEIRKITIPEGTQVDVICGAGGQRVSGQDGTDGGTSVFGEYFSATGGKGGKSAENGYHGGDGGAGGGSRERGNGGNGGKYGGGGGTWLGAGGNGGEYGGGGGGGNYGGNGGAYGGDGGSDTEAGKDGTPAAFSFVDNLGNLDRKMNQSAKSGKNSSGKRNGGGGFGGNGGDGASEDSSPGGGGGGGFGGNGGDGSTIMGGGGGNYGGNGGNGGGSAGGGGGGLFADGANGKSGTGGGGAGITNATDGNGTSGGFYIAYFKEK